MLTVLSFLFQILLKRFSYQIKINKTFHLFGIFFYSENRIVPVDNIHIGCRRCLSLQLSYEIILAYMVGIIFLFFIGRLFLVPLKILLKLLYNCILGAILLIVVNFIGRTFGFFIPLNIFSAALVGFLGIPGLLLLAALKVLYF